MPKATLWVLLVGGCSTGAPLADPADGGAASDAAGAADAAPGASDASPGGPDASEPYRHTIAVDGTSSFSAGEVFATTTASFSAYVTWDDDALYIGYGGADVAAADPGKWLMVYLDVDPGGAGGSPTGERYNTQTPVFPSGFAADFYYRWQSSGGVEDLKAWDGETWQTTEAAVTSAVAGSMLEAAVPLASLGEQATVGLVLLWLNETDLAEAAYGGLYADSFTDGYHESIPIARYLEIDFASPAPPNDPANRRP